VIGVKRIKEMKIINENTINLTIETYSNIYFIEEAFNSIDIENLDKETLNYFYKNLNDFTKTNIIIETVKLLKQKGYNVKITELLNKIDTDDLDFEDIFMLYDMLKQENAIYEESNKEFLEELIEELHYNIKYDNENDIIETCNELTNYLNNYKELIIKAIKMILKEDLRYIKDYEEFEYWLSNLNNRNAIYTKRFLLFMKFILDNNLKNEFVNEINEFKTVIKKYENEIEKAIKKRVRNKKETIRKQIEALILLCENKKLFKYLI